MKFTEGHWAVKAGMSPQFAAEAYRTSTTGDAIEVLAPFKHIATRGDTAGVGMATVRCWAPVEGVIGVRITHHAGRPDPGPSFDVRTDGVQATTRREDDRTVLSSGPLEAVVHDGAPWRLEFVADGRTLTSSGHKAVGFVTDEAGRHFTHEQLSLPVGAHVYGLGERFGPFVKNGQVVDMWNDDGGTNSHLAYKNVPLYLTDAGYGVFVNHPGRVSFEVASENVNRVQTSVEGHTLEYYVIHGPTPKEILRRYTLLTGRPPAVPAWSYGLWLTTSFITEYDEATVTSFVDEMERRGLPLSVFHFDCFWMREFQWCDFEWDPETFPDPVGMLSRLKERGLRVCVWINPYIGQRSPLFAEGAAAGYLLRATDGGVWQWDKWQAGMGIVDFTNPDARRWYQGHLARLLEMGVDCFKTDFGERIPTDVVWHDGSDPERMHNYYTQLYNDAVFEVLREHRGEGEAVLFARSATAGGQQFPVHWGGDSEATYESMAETLRGGLSLAMSGFGYWSHDIGGFEGTPDPTLFKRWLAFGLLSSHSRLHGSRSYRVPWAYDEESVDVARLFTQLKTRLMPYLDLAGQEVVTAGVPMMRPMVLEFPEDPTAAFCDRQYMLGESLLVAPVLDPDGRTRTYLPAGTWTHLLTGRRQQGPGWVDETYDVLGLPLYVRAEALVPLAQETERPESAWGEGVTLLVAHLADGSRRTLDVPGGKGAPRSAAVERHGRVLSVTLDGSAPWAVELLGAPDATLRSAVGGEAAAERTERGVVVRADGGVTSVEIEMEIESSDSASGRPTTR